MARGVGRPTEDEAEELAAELRAHFQDGLAAGRTPEERVDPALTLAGD